MGENEDYLDADFGFTPIPTGSIGDFVWNDTNGDGVQDPGETGIPGITVTLYDSNGDVIATTTTDDNGNYVFEGLPAGDYTVVVGSGPDGTNPSTPTSVDVTLTPGQDITTVDFGFTPIPTGSIGDFVWNDTNGDGVQDPGETGIPGITVTLYDSNGDVIATTTTDDNGNYVFEGLPAGDYTVIVGQGPDGTTPSTPSSITVTLAPGEDITTVDFGFTPVVPELGSIGDFVWLDTNGDGVQDPGETGIPSVIVTLYDSNGDVLATTTTDQNGGYIFNDLPAGDYTVIVGSGPDDTTPSTPTSVSVTLGENEDYLDADFGFTPIPTGSIGDFVWNDTDGDGVQDPGETGIPGITVTLYDSNGDVIATTTTDDNGNYVFDNLPAGDYTVVVGSGPDGTNPSTPTSVDVTLTPGQDITTVDFGFTPIPTGSIGDFVWNDLDGDGVQDPSETGLPGVTITLYDSNGDVIATTTTDSNGNYVFEGLPAGDYTVVVGSGPDGTNPSTPTSVDVTLTPGQDITTVDFGFAPLGSIGDFVWNDTDGDGVQDPGETGIPGIIVTLYDDNGNIIGTTTTDQNGNYVFDNLLPGDYTVIVGSGPDGTNPSTPTSVDVTLAPGQDITTVDFGFTPIPTGSIGDFVWNDTDGDGVQDPGETGIPGVTLSLYDSQGNLVATTTTDQNGNYVFDNLPADEYTVIVGQGPDGTTPSTPSSISVTLAPGEDITTVDFGFTPVIPELGSIGDFVWNDTDGDGVQDPGETGIPGIIVTLYDSNGDVIATTTTNQNGNYVFDNLPAGNYTVTVGSGPDGTEPSTPTSLNVTLGEGEDYVNADFGFTPLPTGSIGDFVWFDNDGDGIQDANEPGIPGITVTLYQNGQPIATTTTNANGAYLFDDLQLGNYTVVVGQGPADHNLTTPNQYNVTLTETQPDVLTADFGFVPEPGMIGNFVWLDADADGIQDPSEVGVPGAVIALINSQGDTIYITTNDFGFYLFNNLPPDEYTVVLISYPNGLTPTTPTSEAVSLQPGEEYLDTNFGLTPAVELGSLGNYVWLDMDGDGQQDGNEPGVSGVTVQLYNAVTNTLTGTTTTDASGAYLFTDLPAGSYYVVFTSPNGYLFTYNNQGNDATDSDANTNGQTGTITLAQGEDNLTVDAGLVLPASLGDFVWQDLDADNQYDLGEPVLPNVTVQLFDSNGQLIGTTTTDAQGIYGFSNLLPGTYTVVVPQLVNGLVAENGISITTNLSSGETDLTLDFPYVVPGVIGDFVWLDIDEDGNQDQGEPGIEGITVILYLNGTQIATTTTNANGTYLFENLAPGNYTVSLSNIPDGLGYTTPQTVSHTLLQGEVFLNADFGLTDNGIPQEIPQDVCTPIFTATELCVDLPNGYEITDYQSVFDCNISNVTQSCVTYTPFPGFTGTDTVTITFCEIGNPNNCLEQVFYVHVGCTAPQANQDEAFIHTNSVVINGQTTNTTTGYQGINIDVLDNDYSCYVLNNPTIVIPPMHGTATVNPATGEIVYVPNPGFSGVDTLTYQTCNNDATCNLCDETIVIIHVDPQPEDCETFETSICVEPLQPETVCPEFCIDGSWHITSATAGYFTGCVIQVVDDCVTYTALPLQTGNDTITVIACSDANPTMCDTAYIYVHIGNCTPPPPACETWTTTFCTAPYVTNTICPVFCPAGNYTITSVTNLDGIDCNITINNGCVQYQGFPTNVDINDVLTIIGCANGVCDTAYAYITVSNNCNGTPNQAPVAVDDSGTSTNGNPVTINVLGNDYDPDGDPLTLTVTQQPANGTLTVNGGNITYTPNPGFNGTDTYTYQICDDATPPLCDQATVTITVTGNSTPPVAVDDSGTSDGGLPVTINVISNDYDLDGDAISVTSYTQPANGTITVNGSQFTYTPNAGFNGTDSFMYQICDNDGNCDMATVTITVINNACEDTFILCAQPMTPVQITPSFCGAGPWTITSATTTFNCSIQIIDNTTVQYTALPLFVGSETITIVGCTPLGVCDTLYYVIDVTDDCQESGRIYVQDENNAQHIAEVLAQDKEVRLTNATATQLSLNNVYPVPATNFVNVAFVSPSNATATLTITDLTGRVMTTNRVDAQQGSNTVNINLNGYTAGMYMVTISTENATATTRFIKQ
ncbi:MAG: carboxypeptidase regulatory-like domain-containing protein [Sphingobacteriales bacterium]|nr:carboxypeptidase regulatory-like domain-containing protein [Sphingobacteriales bacterium]